MKKFTLASIVLATLVAGNSAMAGDILKGLYVNGGIGYGGWSADTTTVNSTTGTCILCMKQTQGGNGSLLKIGVGYDYQINNNLVVGALLDYDRTNFKGTIQDQGPFYAGDIKQESAWAAGARVGWLFNPDTLGYVNLGYSKAGFSGADMQTTFLGTSTLFSTSSFKTGGEFVGFGMETKIAAGWFVRAEYRYANYKSKTLADSYGAINQASITFDPTSQSGALEVVYKF